MEDGNMKYAMSALACAVGPKLLNASSAAAVRRAGAVAAILAMLLLGANGAAVAEAHPVWTTGPVIYSWEISPPLKPGHTVTLVYVGAESSHPTEFYVPRPQAYQWQRCTSAATGCSNISGAVGEDYVVSEADIGKYIRLRLTVYDPADGGVGNPATSNVVGPVQPGSTPDWQTVFDVLEDPPGVDDVPPCPSGQTGIPPACVAPPPESCPPGQVGKPPACVEQPGSGEGTYSTSCADGNAKVVDGFSGSVYASLRVQQNPNNAQETWACYRAWNATGSVDVGGRVDFDQSGGTPGPPVLEPDSSGCSATPVDLGVGPDETPILVGVSSTASDARGCFQVGTFEQSVTVPVPGVGGGLPQVNQDDPTVPDPEERQGPAGYPSSTCQGAPGHTRLANLESGSSWIAAYSAPAGPGETRLCVRAQGPVSAGGMLSVKSTTGVAPVVQGPVADTAPSSCTTNVLNNGSDPARFSIRVSPTNPASLCLSVGSSGQFGAPGQRFMLGTSGAPTVPAVWTPDPGTPG